MYVDRGSRTPAQVALAQMLSAYGIPGCMLKLLTPYHAPAVALQAEPPPFTKTEERACQEGAEDEAEQLRLQVLDAQAH